ncbi:hypothetical protein [Delftia sp. PS-11]|uniref:hypothetical protein n=1 Tax=Delftia sp. PS-11 TaxID=2767222 RepID=UPI0024557B22|nr:hypothetical protein [Delftia sp. PS-11]KAJ8744154.1 hypothetical protein H9T68_14150 [Delftia sp. PS-11]
MKKPLVYLLLASLSGLVLAAIVSTADIAAAIRNSPNASAWLKQNAESVANLATFESQRNTTAYNGSCCYGVLQMNRSNINAYAKVSPEEYRQQSLQQQVNAWSALTTDAMRSSAVTNLLALGTFDGRPVDGHLVLACVQLGTGNCQRMINSGRCSGFADSNGTTICAMADRIGGTTGTTLGAGGGSSSGGSSGSGGTGTGSGSGTGGGSWGNWTPAAGNLADGFKQASGQDMGRVKEQIQVLIVGLCSLIAATAVLGLFRRYAKGQMSVWQLKRHIVQAGMLVSLIVLLATIV